MCSHPACRGRWTPRALAIGQLMSLSLRASGIARTHGHCPEPPAWAIERLSSPDVAAHPRLTFVFPPGRSRRPHAAIRLRPTPAPASRGPGQRVLTAVSAPGQPSVSLHSYCPAPGPTSAVSLQLPWEPFFQPRVRKFRTGCRSCSPDHALCTGSNAAARKRSKKNYGFLVKALVTASLGPAFFGFNSYRLRINKLELSS